MAWIREQQNPPWIHRFCMNVLRCGQMPRHVAFIMDGNRRYAKQKCIEKMEGHSQGFEKLAETLEWCRQLGVREVTVYAFSIENFKRSKEEVDCLLELAEKKFEQLAKEQESLDKHGICVRVLGDLTLLPLKLQKVIAKVVCMSKDNNKAVLNVCMPYTSRDEIAKAIQDIAEGVKEGLILETDITEDLIEKCLLTNKSEDPDLLVRTSGEVRLSDFLLWQSAYSLLSFVKVLWPDYSIWHLYAAILHYQVNYNTIKSAKQRMLDARKERNALLYSEYSEADESIEQMNDSSTRLDARKSKRDARIEKFLHHLDNKRWQYLENLCAKDESLDTLEAKDESLDYSLIE